MHPILLLDSPIVQIAGYEDLVLVSTYTKCVLCNTEREEFKQIGNRPRDGEYGACFISFLEETKIYCSRPGCRLWEVDLDGSVNNTHQYKNLLTTINSQDILFDDDVDDKQNIREMNINTTVNNESSKDSNLQFFKLFKIFKNLILIYNKNNIYIIDPRLSLILLWNNQFKNILSINIVDSVLIIYTKDHEVCTLKIQSIDNYIHTLYINEKYEKCCKLIENNLTYFHDKLNVQSVNLNYLLQMRRILQRKNNIAIMKDIEVLFDRIQEIHFKENNEIDADNQHKILRTQNGVYILDNNYANNSLVGDMAKINNNSNSADKNIKDALVSVVRGTYGKNIRQMIMGMNSLGNDSNTMNTETITKNKIIEIECVPPPIAVSTSKIENEEPVIIRPTTTDTYTVAVDTITHYDNFITKSNKYNLDNILPVITDDDKNVRNLFLIYKSSKISKLNFLDRYANIFDKYDFNMIINLLKNLEQLMVDDDNQAACLARENCIRICFDYLKPEMIYEISDYSRDYIRECFNTINGDRLEGAAKCENCDYPIIIASECLYPEIGKILLQYYWSRGDYNVCFEITKHATHLLEIICKFYIQERNTTTLTQYLFNLANHELFEATAVLYEMDQWHQTFSLLLAMMYDCTIPCLNCGNVCVLSAEIVGVRSASFHSWNYILTIALKYIGPQLVLRMLHDYADKIPPGAIERQFYRLCLMQA